MNILPGALYVVATPIGNLDDITLRAKQVLQNVDLVAAEDPSHTRTLLSQYGLRADLVALHQHNEDAQVPFILSKAQAGASIALVSDAGTPLMSDPGFRLVSAAREAGIRVIPVPGACAAIAALSVAGLPTDRFSFEGFLPAKPKARREKIAQLAAEPRTMVFYESTHRIVDSLRAMVETFGPDRRGSIARELTKLFETVTTTTLSELLAMTEADPNAQKGEFVVMVQGAEDNTDAILREGQRVHALLREHLPPSTAAKLAAEITGAPRKALYTSSGSA